MERKGIRNPPCSDSSGEDTEQDDSLDDEAKDKDYGKEITE